MLAFGPAPSRRLGRSLGINHIPPKVCTYSCVYCQLGRTIRMPVEREAFHEPMEILAAVQHKVALAREGGEAIDYLSFVPDGEPTLDANLGAEIELLKPLGIPIAVISNSSLVWQQQVREDLMSADWVSLKMDAVDEEIWRQVDRPHGRLELAAILEGALDLAQAFRGTLVTETMLVAGINDNEQHLNRLAAFLAQLRPEIAYVAVATRPPAEKWVRIPEADVLFRAYQILSESVERVEYLIAYEGADFAYTGDVEQELLGITAVHPMREDAVDAFLDAAAVEWGIVRRLVADGLLCEAEYGGHRFYVRRTRANKPIC